MRRCCLGNPARLPPLLTGDALLTPNFRDGPIILNGPVQRRAAQRSVCCMLLLAGAAIGTTRPDSTAEARFADQSHRTDATPSVRTSLVRVRAAGCL